MAGEVLHVPRERLRQSTINMHHALCTIMEELEAIDWYAQRADDAQDPQLRDVLLHNMEEEMEHAVMTLEWIRRANPLFAAKLKTYLFTEGDLTRIENGATGRGEAAAPAEAEGAPAPAGAAARGELTVGALKDS